MSVINLVDCAGGRNRGRVSREQKEEEKRSWDSTVLSGCWFQREVLPPQITGGTGGSALEADPSDLQPPTLGNSPLSLPGHAGGSGKFPQKKPLLEAGGVLHRPQNGFRVPRSVLGGGKACSWPQEAAGWEEGVRWRTPLGESRWSGGAGAADD